MAIELNGETIEVDNEGYLLEPADWDLELAQKLADGENIDMEEAHWSVVHFVRDFYEERQVVPEARHALKALREKYGKDKATRKFLYSLFPYGYGQQACKIAGMRKPLKLMLDI
ncbi:MAG: TusE/DsrC/DsvC family sulfur relay protein [Gammaproteobacteria bacterium]